jgi:hypothetical protein
MYCPRMGLWRSHWLGCQLICVLRETVSRITHAFLSLSAGLATLGALRNADYDASL